MGRMVLLVLLGWALTVGFVAAAPVVLDAGKKDGERLKRLFDRPIKTVRPLQGLTAQPGARLMARTGLLSSALPSVRLYGVLLEREVIPTRTVLLDAPWKGKTARIGYAVHSDGGVSGPRGFDEFGKPLVGLDRFLAQFLGQDAVRLTEQSTRPIGEVIQLRDELRAQKKAPPKASLRARWALVRHHLSMFEAERLLSDLEQAAEDEQPLRQPLADFLDHVLRMNRFATHLKAVMKPKEVGQYRRFMAILETEATGVSELLSEGQADQARERVATRLGRACVECHEWDRNHWRQPFREALRTELDAVGFSRGSFVVDVDVRPLGLDPDRAQELAGVVKAALLLAHDIDQ